MKFEAFAGAPEYKHVIRDVSKIDTAKESFRIPDQIYRISGKIFLL